MPAILCTDHRNVSAFLAGDDNGVSDLLQIASRDPVSAILHSVGKESRVAPQLFVQKALNFALLYCTPSPSRISY